MLRCMQKLIDSKKKFYSFEIVPPKTSVERNLLIQSVENFITHVDILFLSVTWHNVENNESEFDWDNFPSFQFVSELLLTDKYRKKLHLLMNLAGSNLKNSDVNIIIKKIQEIGIEAIFVVRGDGNIRGHFEYASDLINFVRHSCQWKGAIGVAGYPQCHPESLSYEDDLIYLKQKVDSGADFIIAQIIFDSDLFFKFLSDSRAVGITVPIIPGLLIISNYESLLRILQLTKLCLPNHVRSSIQSVVQNGHDIAAFGVNFAATIAKNLLNSELIHGIHFFTMNSISSTMDVMNKLATTGKSSSVLKKM